MNTTHYPKSHIQTDHITIDLGYNGYWISIVKEFGSYHDLSELALVKYTRPQSLIHSPTYDCVPLNKWFDSSLRDDELTIDLDDDYSKYHLLKGQPEGVVIAEAIKRAMTYLNSQDLDLDAYL